MTSTSGTIKKVPATFAIPTFDGKESNYDVWKTQFGAFCMIKNISEALESNFTLPADPANLSLDAADKKKEELDIEKNCACVSYLSMAFTTQPLIQLVVQSKTDKYPHGIAKEIMAAMTKKYCPDDTISLVEATKLMTNLSFNENENPAEYFTKLAVIKAKYKKVMKFNNQNIVAVTLSKAPPAYTPSLTAEMSIKQNRLSLKDIEDVMVQQYRLTNNNASDRNELKEDNDREIGLFNNAKKGKGKVEHRRCYICKKIGHLAHAYPLKKSQDSDNDKKVAF